MSKQTETAIGAALAAKGITARIVGLRSALALFRNNGGTYDEALAELNAAYGNDDAKFSSAGRTLSERATAMRMGIEAGHVVPKGQPVTASDSLPDAAKGFSRMAEEAGPHVPDAATKRMPGHARRGLAEIRTANTERNKSLFDTVRLPGDDRSIGDVTWKELQGLARKHAEAYRLLSLIDGYGQPADQDAMVRDVLKEETLREFVEIARLANVH